MRPRSGHSPGRAQSNVIGVVMVVAITVLGVTGILFFGSSAIQDAQRQSELDAAEHAMTQLDSQFSLVALGSSERQASTVDLEGDAVLRVDGDRGWMNVSIINRTSGEVNDTILNTSLGAVVYEDDGTTIAYQGGGVWKRQPSGGSVMVSPPEFHYRTRAGEDPTLTLPLVVVRGNQTLPGEAAVEKAETIAKFPKPGNPDRSNPMRGGEINVTVKSEYYRGWGAFFEARTGGAVEYDHDREQVTITLVVQQTAPAVAGGVVSGAAGNTLTFGQQVVVDSYNSSKGDYGATEGENTSIVSAGDVDLGQNGRIEGDLVTGGTLTFTGGSGQVVTGNVTYGGSPPNEPSRVHGSIESGADVATPGSIAWMIDEREEEFGSSNDNGGESDTITGTTLDCNTDCILGPGNYFVDEIDLNGEVLTLDGDVEIYVDGDVTFDKSSEGIDVTSGGPARLYVDGNFELKQGSTTTTADNATQLWVYMRPGRSALFQKATFVGVLYGPGGGAQEGVDIKLKASSNDIYGGLVGSIPYSGSNAIAQGDRVHFDEALANEDPLGGYGNNQPTVTYMHVTVNRVNVTGG